MLNHGSDILCMTKVLLLADLHNQFGKFDSFLNLEPDMVIIAGDITHFGPVDPVLTQLSRIDIPVFAIPGNCDPREMLDTLEESNAVCLHDHSMSVGKLTLTGLGGSNKTPFDTPYELTEDEIDRTLQQIVSTMERNVHNILVTHAPPQGILDCIGDSHVGSPAIRKYVQYFDLICTAHIHEQRGVVEVDGVKAVNPGEASLGHCALIYFGDEPKEIEIELLTV